MSDEQTSAWRELTDEEIESAAGARLCVNSVVPHGGFLQAVEGLADIIAGHATNNQELVLEGLVDLGLRKPE